jgi:hypothetical protein
MDSQNKDELEFLPDTVYEGKDKAYLDVDRIINEGLSGGSVHMRQDCTNIEETVDFFEESQPEEKA